MIADLGAVSARMVCSYSSPTACIWKGPVLLAEAKFADDVAVSLDICVI